ncbi:transcriptional regulator NrdR [Rothia kristinae]|uniref:transcriptional regulator NrdR n=1 Tax=Rothia kristinae TaxID=37923 RepID=UPI0022E2BA77|nr:transcriptional regulator NrdR [Rothia kristinae]
MHCPYCRHPDSRVVDSRVADDGSAIRRRRQCAACGRRFSTLETTAVNVIKRSGATEPFKRAKIISGVRKACQGRPVSEDDLALLAQEVEESIRAKGLAEIDANDVGLEILKPLQRLDTVAYLRFASVYQAFEGLDDFESAIRSLRAEAGSAPADTAPEDTSREDSAPEDSAPAAGTRGSERGEEDGPQQQTLI